MKVDRLVDIHELKCLHHRFQKDVSDIPATGACNDQDFFPIDSQLPSKPSAGVRGRHGGHESGIDHGNGNVFQTGKCFIQLEDARVGVDQQGIKISIEDIDHPCLIGHRIFFLHQDIPKAADDTAWRQISATDPFEDRIDLKSKCLATERIQFDNKQIRGLGLKRCNKSCRRSCMT